jgi:hypothetical protein
MKALANCKAALEGKLKNEQPNKQLRQLRTLIDNLETATAKKQNMARLRGSTSSAKPPREPTSSRVPSLASSRVPGNEATRSRVQQAPSYMTRARSNEQRIWARRHGDHWRT